MIETSGRVIAVHDGRAEVRLQVADACGKCGMKNGCASGAERTITVDAPSGARPGDQITLGMPAAKLNLGVLLGYLLPAVTTLLGAVFGAPGGDVAAAIGCGIGLVVGLAIVKLCVPLLLGRHGPISNCHTHSTPATGE